MTSKSIKLRDEELGKEIQIIIPERPRFFKFEPNRTYEVEVDLQRFPELRKFKNKEGEEYWACVYNIRILKVDGEPIENPEWVLRRISVGNVNENGGIIQIVPRLGSELYQLVNIWEKFGSGIHRCIVHTKQGDRGQVLAQFVHSDDCDCLKNKSEKKSVEENGEDGSNSVEDSDPEAVAERIKNSNEKMTTTVEGLAERLGVTKEVAEKVIQILKEQGYAVELGGGRYLIDAGDASD